MPPPVPTAPPEPPPLKELPPFEGTVEREFATPGLERINLLGGDRIWVRLWGAGGGGGDVGAGGGGGYVAALLSMPIDGPIELEVGIASGGTAGAGGGMSFIRYGGNMSVVAGGGGGGGLDGCGGCRGLNASGPGGGGGGQEGATTLQYDYGVGFGGTAGTTLRGGAGGMVASCNNLSRGTECSEGTNGTSFVGGLGGGYETVSPATQWVGGQGAANGSGGGGGAGYFGGGGGAGRRTYWGAGGGGGSSFCDTEFVKICYFVSANGADPAGKKDPKFRKDSAAGGKPGGIRGTKSGQNGFVYVGY
jgi:hypothetical protein